MFAWLGERAHAVPLPEVVAPQPGAIAGLLTQKPVGINLGEAKTRPGLMLRG